AKLEIFVAEPVPAVGIVEVQDAEGIVFAADQRTTDGRSDLLHENRLPAEPGVLGGVGVKDCDWIVDCRSRDRLRYRAMGFHATFVPRNLRNQFVAIEQENRDAIDLENL